MSSILIGRSISTSCAATPRHFPFCVLQDNLAGASDQLTREERGDSQKHRVEAFATALACPIEAYPLAERIYDLNAIDFPSSLHVF